MFLRGNQSTKVCMGRVLKDFVVLTGIVDV